MKIQAKTIKTVFITLSDEEAEWLKWVMQNPLHGGNPEDELPENKKYREAFFMGLKHPAPKAD